MVEIPRFPECKHPIVGALAKHTDQELLTLFQRKPESGQYFLAIFCRYSPIVYTLIQHSARSPVQANYLFAMTWRHIYYELLGVELRDFFPSSASQANVGRVVSDRGQPDDPSEMDSEIDGDLTASDTVASKAGSGDEVIPLTLQSWLINITAICINNITLPPTESIHYELHNASPPLWCYLEQSLNQLSPTHRIVVLLAQTFHWSTSRIAAHLRAEGESFSTQELEQILQEGYHQLRERLPEDVQRIYMPEGLPSEASSVSSSVT